MGIDYVVELPCAVKADIPVPTLMALIKGRNQANAVLAAARERGDHRLPSAITFRRQLRRPEGVAEEDFPIQTLLGVPLLIDC